MQVASNDAEQKLTFWGAVKDLSWFTQIFAAAVGGLSILSILEMIFKDHRLIPALQRIVDGYHQLTAVMAAVVEPIFAPVIAWVNATLGSHLVLYPHWRPLFLLGMVFLAAQARVSWREGNYRGLISSGTTTFSWLVAVVLAGLLPLTGSWWQQGLIATISLATMLFCLDFIATDTPSIGLFLAYVGLPFLITAALSRVPAFAGVAGMITIAGVVISLGVFGGLMGHKSGHLAGVRFGLTTLGGFVTAGLILAADAAVKAFV
jgi:hypothetical protein